MTTFGEYIRKKRLEQNLSLRQFCKIYGFDMAMISRLENSREKPSLKEQKLMQLAKALGINKDTSEWQKLSDLASQANRTLPEDINNKVPEVLSLLPAFLRTKDNKQISNEQVYKLIKFLKDQR